MKKRLAEKIAKTLGDASKWHSHGRGIPMERLQGNELKLTIDDFGANKEPSLAIKDYYSLATDFFPKLNMHHYVHTRQGVRRVA